MEYSAGAIIKNNEGKYLIVQGREGSWLFPKGHIEKEETLQETAKREVREETNLEIELSNIHGYTEYDLPNGNKKRTTLFLATHLSGEVKLNEELIAHQWLSEQDALTQLTHDDLKELFLRLLEKGRRKSN